jgi:hypothetical protein
MPVLRPLKLVIGLLMVLTGVTLVLVGISGVNWFSSLSAVISILAGAVLTWIGMTIVLVKPKKDETGDSDSMPSDGENDQAKVSSTGDYNYMAHVGAERPGIVGNVPRPIDPKQGERPQDKRFD